MAEYRIKRVDIHILWYVDQIMPMSILGASYQYKSNAMVAVCSECIYSYAFPRINQVIPEKKNVSRYNFYIQEHYCAKQQLYDALNTLVLLH